MFKYCATILSPSLTANIGYIIDLSVKVLSQGVFQNKFAGGATGFFFKRLWVAIFFT